MQTGQIKHRPNVSEVAVLALLCKLRLGCTESRIQNKSRTCPVQTFGHAGTNLVHDRAPEGWVEVLALTGQLRWGGVAFEITLTWLDCLIYSQREKAIEYEE